MSRLDSRNIAVRHFFGTRRRLVLSAAIALALLGSPGAAFADFASGVVAYEAKDYRRAFTEWLEAANGGDAKAQMRLGRLYESGLGVPQNFVEAHRWYNLAAAGGIGDAAKARDALAGRMSAEQIAEAQKLAAEWRPSAAVQVPTVRPPAMAPTPGEAPSGTPTTTDAAAKHFKAGLAALKAQKADDAIAEFDAGLKIRPDASALFYLGQAYRLNQQDNLARKAYEDSLALDPASSVAEKARKAEADLSAEAQRQPATEQIAQAQRLLDSLGYDAGAADGKATAKTAAAVSAFQRKGGMPVDGQVSANLLAALNKENADRAQRAEQHFRVGFYALKAEDYDQAIREFKAGIAIRDSAEAEYFLGESYRIKGDDGAAQTAFKRSLALDPGGPAAGLIRAEQNQMSARNSNKPAAGGSTKTEAGTSTKTETGASTQPGAGAPTPPEAGTPTQPGAGASTPPEAGASTQPEAGASAQTAVVVPNKTAAAVPIKIAHSIWVGYGPLYIARDKGFFKKHGVDVELAIMEDAKGRFAALQAGRIDMIASTVEAPLRYLKGKDDFQYICAIDGSNGADGIVAKKDIQSIADLKGRTVAVNEGSVSEFYLSVVLAQAGVKETDIKTVNMTADAAGSAFVAAKVDAAVTWEPWLTRGKTAPHGHLLTDSSKTPGLIADVFIVPAAVATKRAEELRGVVAAWYEAVAYAGAHPGEANEIMAKGIGGWLKDPKVFAETLQGTRFYGEKDNQAFFGTKNEPGPLSATVKEAIGVWGSRGKIAVEITPSDLINYSFVGG